MDEEFITQGTNFVGNVQKPETLLRHFSGERFNVLESVKKPEDSNANNLPALRSATREDNNLLVPKRPWSIVLYRREDGITVLHNPDKRIVSVKQVPSCLVPYNSVRDNQVIPEGFEINTEPEKCSMCGRPWPEKIDTSRQRNGWINSEYFSYLENLRLERVFTIFSDERHWRERGTMHYIGMTHYTGMMHYTAVLYWHGALYWPHCTAFFAYFNFQ